MLLFVAQFLDFLSTTMAMVGCACLLWGLGDMRCEESSFV